MSGAPGLAAGVAAMTGAMRANADRLDPEAGFPAGDLDGLRALGVLAAPLPPAQACKAASWLSMVCWRS